MKNRNPGYKAGDHWAICDVCGIAYRSSELKKTWDNLIVCEADYEARHPQDFVRSKEDNQSAKGIVRPEPTDAFVTVDFPAPGCTYFRAVAGNAVAGCAITGT